MMYFLSACQDYSFLSVILFIKRLLEIICLLIPIALILMSAIDVSKIVLNPDPRAVKAATSSLIKRMIASVGIFFIPTLVSLLLSLVGTVDYKATACWTNANPETIAAYKAAHEAGEEVDQENIKKQQELDENERKIVEATREAVRDNNKQKADEAAKNASVGSTGTATQLAAKLIEIAQKEADNPPVGSPNKYTYGYGALGGSYKYAWCAAFVWWVSNEAGVYPTEVDYKSAGVTNYLSYFKNNKNGTRFEPSEAHGGTYVPKMGDYIFFDWQGNVNDGDHIGLVKGVSGDKVLIIDGNFSNTVKDRSKYLSDIYIIGYGVWE